MSWVRFWVHLVFSTKDRKPFLDTTEKRIKTNNHILQNVREKEIQIIAVNGSKEHIHCLVCLKKEDTISHIAQMIKGESSFWINKNSIVKGHFSWQDDYWAVSISESHVRAVKDYIAAQEEHHKKRTFWEEIELLIAKYEEK